MPYRKFVFFLLVVAIIVVATVFGSFGQESAKNVRIQAWGVFENYLLANQNHDVGAVSSLTRKLSDACLNPETESECFARMDYVVEVAKDLKEENFTNVWFDEKQIILFSDFKPDNDDVVSRYKGSYIFFIRDGNGNPQVAGLDPERVWSFKDNSESSGVLDVEEQLQNIIDDRDSDTIPDVYETCINPEEECDGTNPDKRDTDGDGWWDGMEEFVIN
ncbi:MAG: hypothetical protein A2653_00495 [Candidatus Zambryskibacteria bacterium RIFCSPHIGHO2_01_FULL_43_25]|uniref:Uncharacterized protein n=1 Tax=Candidatus Zambryskibacteria bacterium RIFCSPLOWO2_01_FULL_45_21 TaxID=1802761 RepID=A0A1G2U1J1_9BACT|nr:MAG: hypothetical protein A2653_00495 [Candidatus Zambryskibacteria bacterium RIFCSPHIGHO2_01_FULL_43_25]OHB01105.1 MAG: hypothetical protein A3E94_00635 [Candidatus Zambryskibacteria bacterium RIFCSPHIGHO2_12_FULL_44_12b]OHB03344.1 MAG: hypothetical protein A3B14_00330 [Candidatus Zambryskibacteria bacterium RIFCSPLOWO2_01_FULL_45_21]